MGRLPVFVDEVPKYSIRREHLHVVYRRGIELVLPISIALAGLAEVQEVIAKWKLETIDNGVVVPMRRKKRR